MGFDCEDVSVKLIGEMRVLVPRILIGDKDLASQVRKATNSILLNVAEGRERTGADRTHHFKIALGSVSEVRAALVAAVAWGYITDDDAVGAREYLERLMAMLWRLGRAPRGAAPSGRRAPPEPPRP